MREHTYNEERIQHTVEVYCRPPRDWGDELPEMLTPRDVVVILLNAYGVDKLEQELWAMRREEVRNERDDLRDRVKELEHTVQFLQLEAREQESRAVASKVLADAVREFIQASDELPDQPGTEKQYDAMVRALESARKAGL